jgi:MFS family permease
MLPSRPRQARVPLGRQYRKLWTAATISTLGDGVYLTALPLLAASLTRDPFQVSLVNFAGWLPWLLFGLLSGALVDRLDRRSVMWTVDAARFAMVGGLAVAVALDRAGIPLLVAAGFLLGTGQTLFDTASQSLIPALVSRDQAALERANSRLYATTTVGQSLAGPPAGGFLFTVATWVPFAADAVSFVASSALIASIRGRFASGRAADGPPTRLRAEIAEGLAWLAHHRLLRALALMVGGANLGATAGEAILVLFAQERLGLGSVGYGVLLTGQAVGGLAGSAVASRISQRIGAGTTLIATVFAMAGALLGIGVTSSVWLAGTMLAIVGAVATIFNVIGVSLRQALVPDALMGRVVGTYRLVALGVIPLGSLLGGVLGRSFGLPAPFLAGGALLIAIGLLGLPVVNNQTVRAARLAGDGAGSPTQP